MSESEVVPRSRRAVLMAALGAATAAAAGAIGRPRDVNATDNAPLVVGQINHSTKVTSLIGTSSPAMNVTSSAGTAIQLSGTTNGLDASVSSGNGTAVRGMQSATTGLGAGVYGESHANQGVGVLGASYNGAVGVMGISGATTGNNPPPGVKPAKAGVFGWANEDSTSIAVSGKTNFGKAIEGISSYGIGVHASAGPSGMALHVDGRTHLSRSGILTIATGQSSITKSGVALSATSMVIAVAQSNVSGTWVRCAVPNVAGSSFIVRLNKAATASVKIAWMVID